MTLTLNLRYRPCTHYCSIQYNIQYSIHNIIAKPDGILITRNNFRLNQPICFTSSYGLNSVRYDGAKRWNNLDKDVKGCVTLDAFKHAIEN